MMTDKPSLNQNNRTPKQPKRNTSLVKYLLAVSSIAGTLGLWNFLSNRDLINQQVEPEPTSQPVAKSTLAPLPTLASLVVIDPEQFASVPVALETNLVQPLRQVSAPVFTPVESASITVIQGSTSGGSTAAAPAPVTNTHSS